MMLTTKSRYAVMAILEVASNNSGRPMKLSDISNNQAIPLNYLEQLFVMLKKAEIVKSVKGPGGGYFLNRDPKELKIIDIIDGVEENTKMTRCAVDKNCRKNGVKCMTHDLWKGLGAQIRDYFSAISVMDIINSATQPVTYLDHNSTTELLSEAKKTMVATFARPLNASAIHSYGREGKKIIETARKQIADLVGIRDHFRDYQITFTASGTEANNLILGNFKEDEIFISAIEHASILSHIKFQNNIKLIAVDENGLLNTQDLIAKLSESKASRKLVSVIFANNETGIIQNIKEITKIAHSFGALVHSDAVQAVGKISVDLIDLDIDFMTISAHKIGGPIGAGALISKLKNHLIPHIIGGGQEKGLRSGTENIAAIAGFGAAASIAQREQKSRYENSVALRDYLEEELKNHFPAIKIVSQKVLRLPNTSLIINNGKKAETQIIAFDLQGVAISSGAACSSGKIGVSPTLSAMKISEQEQNSAIRVSLGFSTTKKDVDRFLEKYKEINR